MEIVNLEWANSNILIQFKCVYPGNLITVSEIDKNVKEAIFYKHNICTFLACKMAVGFKALEL